MKILLFSVLVSAVISVAHSDQYEYCKNETYTWFKFKDHCYNFMNTFAEKYRVSYYRAEEKCKASGAHLVSIHSEEENQFILDVMTNKFFSDRQWIGLNSLQGDNNLQWSDGSPVDYTKFVNKTLYKKEKCFVYYRNGGGWRPDHCQLQYLPICKKPVHNVSPTPIPPVTTPAPEANCPSDWLQFGQKCYKYFGVVEEERKKFRDAKDACIALGENHDLVSIHSMEEQAFLTQHLSEWKNSTWIGYNYIESDQIGHVMVFGWTDNSRSDFTYWAPGRPTTGTWKYCAMLSYEGVNKGEWIDDYCETSSRGYICARSPVPNLPTQPPEPSTCDEGYIGYRNSCYQYNDTPKTWLDAEQNCKESGGHLVSITDSSEFAFLYNNIPKESNLIWTGLTYLTEKSSILQWTDGQPFYFSSWSIGQPTLSRVKFTDNCIATVTSNDFKWNITACDEKHPYICKINHDKTPYVPKIKEGMCPVQNENSTWLDIGDDYCYHIGDTANDRLQWGTASRYCMSRGLEFVTLSSKHQAQTLMTYLWNKPYNYWLGLIKTSNGSFIWSDQSPMIYSNWAPREPTTWFAKNDCAVISTRDSKWYSKDCSDWSGTICRLKKL